MEDLVAQGAVEVDEEARRGIYQQINELIGEFPAIWIQVATDPRIWVFEVGARAPIGT